MMELSTYDEFQTLIPIGGALQRHGCRAKFWELFHKR